MTAKFNKKILAVLMEWEYCDPKRGPSLDREYFYKNLKKLAADVEPFWYDGYINDIPKLQELLLEKAKAYKPDLVFFVPYLDQFKPETLELLKKSWPTFAWFGDDTWRFELYPALIAKHFTHVATTDPFSVAKYKAIGIEPILSQWAGQPAETGERPLPPEKYDQDVSFVGGYNRYRAWYIEKLRQAGLDVKCFGAGWPAGKVSFAEMDNIFYRSKINLNLSNSVSHDLRYIFSSLRSAVTYFRGAKRAEQIKARNFEIPLSGGFQLTNYVAGIEKYLKIGEEVAVFSTPEECAQQIRYYLANESERAGVLKAGYERSRKEHTYEARLKDILLSIWGGK